ncbi:MAG: hypothetical protein HYS12_08420 [Planctomycetes bacterium]|nr:hypothetical protein [Planctomycetota bacterium]
MSYTEFTLEKAEKILGVSAQPVHLFPSLSPVAVPAWLRDTLTRGMELALLSEKARSEFIVVPILLACREQSGNAVAIYSGQRLDVRQEQGLVGECDFILAATPPVPVLRAPLVTIVEAKKNDIEGGLGQCVAQMVAARLFNEQEGAVPPHLYGCVTTGEAWQFLRLDHPAVLIDRARYYIDNVGGILAAWQEIIKKCLAGKVAPAAGSATNVPRGESPSS